MPPKHQTYPDDKNPFDERKAKATDGAVAACDGVGQTEGQAEADPVEQEGHWSNERSMLMDSENIRIHSTPQMNDSYLLKKASMKIPSLPTRSWSASLKSSLGGNSSSWQ